VSGRYTDGSFEGGEKGVARTRGGGGTYSSGLQDCKINPNERGGKLWGDIPSWCGGDGGVVKNGKIGKRRQPRFLTGAKGPWKDREKVPRSGGRSRNHFSFKKEVSRTFA